jgi:hypothetical protein
MRFFELLGNAMAGALDVSVGMLIAASLAYVLGVPFEAWFFILGAVFALLPDIDIALPILRGSVTGDHRATLMHRPALILGATALVGGLASAYAGTLFFLLCPLAALLWHYLHDTGGWIFGQGAIAWKWPFASTFYSFDGAPEGSLMSHSEWVRIHWLMAGALSRKELSAASLLLGLAIAIPYGALLGLLAAAAGALMSIAAWAAYARYAKTRPAHTHAAY